MVLRPSCLRVFVSSCLRVFVSSCLRVSAKQIIRCTGFEATRPGGGWLDDAIREMELPCAPCGYPLVGPDLQWSDGIYVTGPLAELELGPVARNIVGARNAAGRFRAA